MQTIAPADIIVGVDIHTRAHAAFAVDGLGARLGPLSIPVSPKGYRELEMWARAFGIEATGSYGAGLSRALVAQGHTVVEVNRPNRQLRHQQGKSDPLDAEGAARSVLAGQATERPKSGTSAVEMIRRLKVVRDIAVKSRTRAMITLKTLIVNAPAALREQLDRPTSRMVRVRHLAGLRPGPPTSTTASTKSALNALARRWRMLDAEIKEHDPALDDLTNTCPPGLKDAFGIAAGTVAAVLILVGDSPERIRSEAAFAKLRGVCPVPASRGQTNRHRSNRGGNRKANGALYRVVIVRMRRQPPTLASLRKRLAEGLTKRGIIRCLKRFVAREIYTHLCGRLRGSFVGPAPTWCISATAESFMNPQGPRSDDAQGREGVPAGVRDLRRCRSRATALHRRGLPYQAAALRARIPQPRGFRGATRPADGQNRRPIVPAIRSPLQPGRSPRCDDRHRMRSIEREMMSLSMLRQKATGT